jgi:hypothetical protein
VVILISTVGIDGDFLYGINMAGANEYLLAIQAIIVLFMVIIAVWMIYPRFQASQADAT